MQTVFTNFSHKFHRNPGISGNGTTTASVGTVLGNIFQLFPGFTHFFKNKTKRTYYSGNGLKRSERVSVRVLPMKPKFFVWNFAELDGQGKFTQSTPFFTWRYIYMYLYLILFLTSMLLLKCVSRPFLLDFKQILHIRTIQKGCFYNPRLIDRSVR